MAALLTRPCAKLCIAIAGQDINKKMDAMCAHEEQEHKAGADIDHGDDLNEDSDSIEPIFMERDRYYFIDCFCVNQWPDAAAD